MVGAGVRVLVGFTERLRFGVFGLTEVANTKEDDCRNKVAEETAGALSGLTCAKEQQEREETSIFGCSFTSSV